MADNEAQRWYRSGRVESLFERYMSLSDTVAEALWKICVVIGVLLVGLIAGQVFTRYVLGWVPTWGTELARYMGVWIALLLTPAFIRTDKHLQVEILFRKLSTRAQRIVRTVQLFIIAAVGWIIANWGIVYAIERGFGQSSPTMDFQMFWMYLGLPVSGALIVFFAVAKMIEINLHPDTLEEDYLSRFGSASEIADSNEEVE